MGNNDNRIPKTISKDGYRKVKRVLTDKEFDTLVKLEDSKKQKKYLEKLQDELWEVNKVQRDWQNQEK